MADYQDVLDGPRPMGFDDPYGSSAGYWGGKRAGWYDQNGNPTYADEEGAQYQQSGEAIDAADYRSRGEAANQRTAYQPDYGRFGAAEEGFLYGQQQAQNALGLQRQAAEGRAPSAAEIAGKSALSQSLNQQMAAAGSARGGPLAQASAMTKARNASAAFQQQAIQGIQAGRANELATARGQYAGSAYQYGQNQLGQQQMQLGKTQQQLAAEMAQRQLNQNQEQYYEDKRFGVQSQGLASDFARRGQQFNESSFAQNSKRADEQLDHQKTMDWVNASQGPMSALNPRSDDRAKNPLISMSGQQKAPPSWLTENEDVQRRKDAGEARHGSGDIIRRNPYEDDAELDAMLDDRRGQGKFMQDRPAAWLDHYIQRENAPAPQVQKPRMSFDAGWGDTGRDDADRGVAPGTTDFERYAYSDERAKREAYEMGRAHTLEQIKADPKHAAQLEEWKKTERGNLYKQQALDAEAAKKGGPAAKTASLDETAAKASDAVSTTQSPEQRARIQAAKDLGMQRRGDDIARGENLDGGDEEYRHKLGLDKAAPPAAPAPAPSLYERAQAGLLGLGAYVRSDEDAKERTVDLDEPESIDLDERTIDLDKPEFDQRPKMGMEFRRDTPGDQRRVKRGYEDAAGRQADADIAGMRTSLASGPSVNPHRSDNDLIELQKDANRRMAGFPYTYKDGYVPPDQTPGELNFGPSAQELEKNAITSTAVKKDPQGMRLLDVPKLVKTQASAIASLQKQIDRLEGGR